MSTVEFMRALIQGFSKWLSELKADLSPIARSARRCFTALSAIRVIGIILITIFAFLGSNHFNIMRSVDDCIDAMTAAAYENFDIGGWGDHPNYQQLFGETVFTLYASLALVCFTVAFWRRSSADLKAKIILSLMSVFMLGAVGNFIFRVINEDNAHPTGWWGGFDGFAIQTLSPIAFLLFFGYAYRLLWKATKPNAAPATPEQAAGDHQRISLFIVGLRKIKEALRTLWSSVWSHPWALSLGIVTICLIVLGISQHDTPPDREGLRQQVLRIEEDIKLFRNMGHRQADMAENLEFLEYRGGYIVGYGIIADAAELDGLKKAMSLANAVEQLRIVNDPSLALAPNRAWRPTAEAIQKAKLYGNSTADIAEATGIDVGQLAKAMRELANRWHLSTGGLARLDLSQDFLRCTEEMEEIASRSSQLGTVWLSSK